MNDAPEFSIIIPVHNRSRLLMICLESVAAQSYRPIHVVVVDNNSTDGSAQIAERWAISRHEPDFRITVVREDIMGASAARNRGLREVTSDYVMAFDSDDRMHEELVRYAMDAFRTDDNTDIVTWRVLYHTLKGDTRTLRRAARPYMRNHILHAILRTQGYAVKTKLLRRVGGWNEELPAWNDWELGARLLCHKPNIVSIGEILADAYASRISITGTGFAPRAGSWERAIDYVEKAIETCGDIQAKKWLRLVNYRRVVLAAHYQAENRPDLASSLMGKALAYPDTKPFRSPFLRFAFRYISKGGRGVGTILRPFF